MGKSREDLKVAETTFLFVTNLFHVLPLTSRQREILSENRTFGGEAA
jgi:hypothetical protein